MNRHRGVIKTKMLFAAMKKFNLVSVTFRVRVPGPSCVFSSKLSVLDLLGSVRCRLGPQGLD